MQNNGRVTVNGGGVLNNSVTIQIVNNAQILNNGVINNFFCAYIFNVATITNFSTINNQGFIHIFPPGIISPNQPNNINNGMNKVTLWDKMTQVLYYSKKNKEDDNDHNKKIHGDIPIKAIFQSMILIGLAFFYAEITWKYDILGINEYI